MASTLCNTDIGLLTDAERASSVTANSTWAGPSSASLIRRTLQVGRFVRASDRPAPQKSIYHDDVGRPPCVEAHFQRPAKDVSQKSFTAASSVLAAIQLDLPWVTQRNGSASLVVAS